MAAAVEDRVAQLALSGASPDTAESMAQRLVSQSANGADVTLDDACDSKQEEVMQLAADGGDCNKAADIQFPEPVDAQKSTDGGAIKDDTTAEDTAKGGSDQDPLPRPDVLYCLRLLEENQQDRRLYKDTPWKGINSGLPGSEPDPKSDTDAVLVYYIDADVKDKTKKEANTASTWRDEPVDFEFGRDAVLQRRYWPALSIYSKKILKVLEQVLDYWPYLEDDDFFGSELKDNIVVLMSCYAELKEYFNGYLQSLPAEQRAIPKLAVESCGDEAIAEARRPYLDYGALDVSTDPCDEETASDLAVLLRLLAGMYRVKVVPTLTSIFLDKVPTIKYDNLWILFRPGTTVYVRLSAFTNDDMDGHYNLLRRGAKVNQDSQVNDEYMACVIANWDYVEADKSAHNYQLTIKHLDLEMWNVQYDGTAFQRIARNASIPVFEGARPLWDLPTVPALLFDKHDGGHLRRRLEKRGHKYLSIVREPAAIRTYSHTAYEGQIIIDPDAYRQYHADPDGRMSSSSSTLPVKIGDGGAGHRLEGLTNFTPADSDAFPRLNEVIILLPRRMEGFALKSKHWTNFEIEYISEEAPLPTDNQIESELILVLDSDKDTLRTVLPRGEHPIGITQDFVEGKGEGKIFLLYGGPGTGKTLTVECVANDTCRPLLRLTAQDVGLLENVESHLRKWFTLAAKWDAILLIDEADLFLEQRKEGDLSRNSLSTVFLRTMEYYKGVLFLTTNRPGHIDDSFISRITYPINYPPLSQETKAKLVDKFVDRFEETNTVEFEPSAVRYLKANCDALNGRQIRNMLQNAVASAETKLRAKRRFAKPQGRGDAADSMPVHVNLAQIKAAVNRQSEFQEYLQELRGRDERSRARSKHDYLSVPPGSPR